MRFNHLFRVFTSVVLLMLCQIARAEPMLNGIGVHQELGQEVFIGALYSESLSNDADTLMTSAQPMRMELKIVAPDGLTTRRFSRMWIEGMAVNSKVDVLTAQADNMVKFDGLFKGRFQKNDFISFANNPGKGVDVAVNGVLLGNISDNEFFSMLLSTWIGKIPLSSDYRDSLLKVGDVDAGLRGRYSAISTTAARTAEIKTWTGTQVEVKTAEASSAKSSAKAKTETAVIAKPEVPKFDVPTIEKPTLNIPIPTTQAEKASSVTTVAATSSAAAKPAVTAAKPVVAAAEEDEEEGPALTAQTLLARQFYVSDAIKKIRSKTRYPQRALDRGQAGNVRVAIVIDRQGNVLSTKLLESSKYDMLNKEALDALQRSAPFPPLPVEIAGARFEFTVPMRWALPE
ncbi:TonB family protein [Cellvibrio sp. OA-2007]|uniref:TonB family protein n=1 Tax=Cellvibrio sp. OA-2007 TaxID=529823 RepID=UPI000A04C6A5|nr:TonB family protein [Cellvibrio sp. OA-2007]